ncbi:hypothetical protein HYU19_06055 [Candidatus Woesearchaeota archaeon]|nr:hypothetical protein [Candidatus Woesearchaeota archaeon]
MTEQTTTAPKSIQKKEQAQEAVQAIKPAKWYGTGHENPDMEARFLEFEFYGE